MTDTMSGLVATDLSLTAKEAALVEGASFRLAPGEFIVLLGPNGAGKTSLIRASLGLEKPSAGTATLGGEDTSELSPIDRARRLAYLPQIRPLAWPNSVRDVVALGRFSHGAALGRLGEADADAVERHLRVAHSNGRLVAGRPPSSHYHGPVLVVRASDTAEQVNDPALGWGACSVKLDTVDVAYRLNRLLAPDAAPAVMDEVVRWIETRQSVDSKGLAALVVPSHARQ